MIHFLNKANPKNKQNTKQKIAAFQKSSILQY